jgi:hypothetical protein
VAEENVRDEAKDGNTGETMREAQRNHLVP